MILTVISQRLCEDPCARLGSFDKDNKSIYRKLFPKPSKYK